MNPLTRNLMFKKITFSIVFIILGCSIAQAQTTVPVLKTYRIAIFSPLYLDSIFSGDYYNYNKGFPKFAQPGLNFVQGAQIALDSMILPNANTEVSIYDSKSSFQEIPWLISTRKLDSMDLLIGAVKDAEFLQLAAFAKQKNIPFISAAFPNDGGVTVNPFLVIVNSTLKAHCEAIHSYLLQKHGTDKIILATSNGIQENKIAGYFKAINESEGKPLINLQIINADDNFTQLKNQLDSNRNNVIIGGSLNENFSADLVKAVYAVKKKYRTDMIGMPNWDGFTGIKKGYKDFPIYYTSPYYIQKTDMHSRNLQSAYLQKYKVAASDMSYKGYESIYMFGNLMSKYPYDFISHLNDATRVFNQYNFKPVYLNQKNSMPDYFENKHLYFMKILNGTVSRAW